MKKSVFVLVMIWMVPYLWAADGTNLLKVPDFEVDVETQKIKSDIMTNGRKRFSYATPQKGFYMNITETIKPSSGQHFQVEFDPEADFKEGDYSLKIDATGIEDPGYKVMVMMPTDIGYLPNTAYKFTGWLKSNKESCQARLYIMCTTDGKHTYKYQKVSVGQRWKKYSVEMEFDDFKEIKGNSVWIYLMSPDSILWIDGLKLEIIEPQAQ